MKTVAKKLLVLGAAAIALAVHAENVGEIIVPGGKPVLTYSALLGGTALDSARAVAVDKSTGNIYVAGNTRSSGLATPGAFQTTLAGGKLFGDGFVAKFDSTGSNLLYFTYLGGSGDEAVIAIAIGTNGSAFVAGATTSTNFPTNPPQDPSTIFAVSNPKRHVYSYDGFIGELSSDGSALNGSIIVGSTNADQAIAVAVDGNNNAYFTGFAGSGAFIIKIGSAGSTNYLSGIAATNGISPQAIAVDSGGNAFITGYTSSPDFVFYTGYISNVIYAATNTLKLLSLNGTTNPTVATDVFFAKLDPSGNFLFFTNLFEGSGNDYAFGVALDSDGDPYLTGLESSANFPADASFGNLTNSTSRAFLARLTSAGGTNYSSAYSVIFGGKGANQGISVAVDSAKNAIVVGDTTSRKGFPTNNIPDAARGKNAGARDVFVAKFDSTGTNQVHAFYLGGTRNDVAHGVAEFGGTSYVVGQTFSSKFPQTNAAPRKLMGRSDGFMTIIAPQPPVMAPPSLITPLHP